MPEYLPDAETMGLAEEIAELNKDTPHFEHPLDFEAMVDEVDFIDMED